MTKKEMEFWEQFDKDYISARRVAITNQMYAKIMKYPWKKTFAKVMSERLKKYSIK